MGLIGFIEAEIIGGGMFSGVISDKKTPMIHFAMEQFTYDAYGKDEEVTDAIDKLYKFIQNAGYFIATKKENISTNGLKLTLFTIHPKFIVEVTESIYNKFDGKLYHITMTRNLGKIKKNGFIPKNSGSYADQYPDRIYFFPGVPKHYEISPMFYNAKKE